MGKPPDDVDALLLRMRTMKWQAVSVLASSRSGLDREEAASVIAIVDGLSARLINDCAPETIKAVRERIESVARLRDHEPRRRGAGRS
jgi:hypothetical protein